MTEIKKKNIVEYLCVILLITAMTAAAELTGENEIIFPEIAALAAGSFLAPAMVWRTSYTRMVICVALCALIGVCIVCFVPAPLWIQLTTAYACGQILLMCSGTTFVPMISAIALPVLMQTRSMVYPVSAVVLAAAAAALRIMLEMADIKERNVYERQPLMIGAVKNGATGIVIRTALAGLGAWLCIQCAGEAGHIMKFCIAPPLLVAFTELSKPECPAGKRRIHTVILVTLCALAGALCRGVIVMYARSPSTLAAAAISVAVIALMKSLKLYFPPAAALAVLALLIPDSAVTAYPVQVFIGITVIAVVSKVMVCAAGKYTAKNIF